MKQRITYVVKDPEEFSPEQLKVNQDSQGPVFTIQNVDAAKEHRITLGLDELPEELNKVFQQWHELHIRWTSPRPYTATPPFTSRVSPGLHIFFTPLAITPEKALCEALHSFVSKELKCSTTMESSIKMPILSKRFSMSTSNQYYAYLGNIDSMTGHFQSLLCGEKRGKWCMDITKEFMTSRYIDVDYDTISRAVVLTAGWPSANKKGEGWTEEIGLASKDATVEIGVLSLEGNADPEDIQFGGFLTVLGHDERPKPTRFQTPTRHYPLLQTSSNPTATPNLHPLTFSATFAQPTGLHPTLTLTFPAQHLKPADRSCKLHAHLTLPSYLFIDKYQFTDALFLTSKNLKSLRSLSGATDLEAPDWVIPQWGSSSLFELSTPSSASSNNSDWRVSIPLHLRYLPAAPSSHGRVPVPWPAVFWACRADSGAQHTSNPFDRRHLGYEGLFGPKTRFLHVEPRVGVVGSSKNGNGSGWDERGKGDFEGEMLEWLDVPVLDTRRAGWVEAGTTGVVLVAFLGLCWVLFGKAGKGVERKGKETEKKAQ